MNEFLFLIRSLFKTTPLFVKQIHNKTSTNNCIYHKGYTTVSFFYQDYFDLKSNLLLDNNVFHDFIRSKNFDLLNVLCPKVSY